MHGARDLHTAFVVGNQRLVCQSIVHILRDAGSLQVYGGAFSDLPCLGLPEIDVIVCIVDSDTSIDELEEIIQELSEHWPYAKVACLFLDSNDAAMVAAVRAGATGIIDESVALGLSFPDDLLSHITRVAQGEFVCSPPVAHRLAQFHARSPWPQRSAAKGDCLTQREQEVLCLLSEGRTNRDIATHLSLSEHTVRT